MPNQSPHSLPTLCDPHEVATLFKVSRRTVYSWVEGGRLPALRLHGRLRFDRSTLTKLLQPDPNSSEVTL
jgi:excisionase family DNA binding protein